MDVICNFKYMQDIGHTLYGNSNCACVILEQSLAKGLLFFKMVARVVITRFKGQNLSDVKPNYCHFSF